MAHSLKVLAQVMQVIIPKWREMPFGYGPIPKRSESS